MPKKRYIVCLDFDGVVHSYTSPWRGALHIPDEPVPEAFEFMQDCMMAGYDVVIHSSRARHIFGVWAMRRWLKKHAKERGMWDGHLAPLRRVKFYRMKPPAVMTFDDRAERFTGLFPTISFIKEFKPWNRK